MQVIEQEARGGLLRLRGARLRATVPLTQEILDRLLKSLSMRIEVHAGNQIDVSWRGFRAAAEIVGVTPDLAVVLSASWLSRTALRAALAWKPGLHTYLAQQEKFIYIMCARIPAVARYRYWWRHLADVKVRTAPGKLIFDLDAYVR